MLIFPLPTADEHRGGYTLAELVVVLVILGLLTAIAAPRLVTRSDTLLIHRQSAAVANLLRRAQLDARRRGVSTRVFIDPKAGKAWRDGQPRDLILDPDIELNATGADIESVDNSVGIRFFAGGMSTGGEINMQLGARKRTIRVIWADGEVRNEPG